MSGIMDSGNTWEEPEEQNDGLTYSESDSEPEIDYPDTPDSASDHDRSDDGSTCSEWSTEKVNGDNGSG